MELSESKTDQPKPNMVVLKRKFQCNRWVKRRMQYILAFSLLVLIAIIMLNEEIKKIAYIEISVHLNNIAPQNLNEDNKSDILPQKTLDMIATIRYKQFTLPTPQTERRDWNDNKILEADQSRVGPGEHGHGVTFESYEEKKSEKKLYRSNGFNALASEKISVNRSVPDARPAECKTRKYLAKLPRVSVILIFYNEHFHTLLRSIHSIVNRTPKELLEQIVLVDDFSSRVTLKAPLDDYISKNFPPIIKIVRNQKRLGLIGARLAGAKSATGEVLVIFDSHIEVNYNWLPPLLEPIAINSKISTCPMVDNVLHNNFEYAPTEKGSRGGFNWRFSYKQLSLLREDKLNPTLPYRNPVMIGGLFAISKAFFWDLGGYDDGLDIWGAEQFELSFKIWMCGGMILDVPCSHVAHIFRGPMDERPNPRSYNFVIRNQKRVAEVWMDEYKQYVYNREPENYAKSEAGDLTRQHAVRQRLKCKSFDWYMKTVAFDFLVNYPPIEPPSYAWGAIKNAVHTEYCLDTMSKSAESRVGLFQCAENLTNPQPNQFWQLSAHREVRHPHDELCLDVQGDKKNIPVWMWECHLSQGNQFWYYDRKKKWLVHGQKNHRCLEAINDKGYPEVVANKCDKSKREQRWTFATVNNSMLDNFFDNIVSNES